MSEREATETRPSCVILEGYAFVRDEQNLTGWQNDTGSLSAYGRNWRDSLSMKDATAVTRPYDLDGGLVCSLRRGLSVFAGSRSTAKGNLFIRSRYYLCL